MKASAVKAWPFYILWLGVCIWHPSYGHKLVKMGVTDVFQILAHVLGFWKRIRARCTGY